MKKIHVSTWLRTLFIVTAIVTCCFIILIILPRPFYKTGFTSLSATAAYAKTIDETTKPDSDNTIKPDFSSYFQTQKPTWQKNLKEKLIWLLHFIRLTSAPQWSASFFKTQLEDVVKSNQDPIKTGQFLCKLKPTAASKIIIFGNLQGAFHSLVRDLTKLKELNIIDDTFKIASPHDFIIFEGDVVSRSPFSMQTLSLVMKLIQVNPKNIVYLRGNHESNNYWQEHTLKTELQLHAAQLSDKTIPLAEEINKFFGILPLALYIPTLKDDGAEVIRISDSGRGENEQLNEQHYAKFLTSNDGTYLCFPLKAGATDDGGPRIDVRVIFKGEKKRETFQPHTGLRLLPSDMGSTAWTILSCPTPVYQKALKFVYDAFVILTPAPRIEDWKITLYHRNITSQDAFATKTYLLLSGVEDGAQAPTQTQQSPALQESTKIPTLPAGAQQPTPQQQEPSQTETDPHIAQVLTKTQELKQQIQAIEKTLQEHVKDEQGKSKQESATTAKTAETTARRESIEPAAESNQQQPASTQKSAFEPIEDTTPVNQQTNKTP